MPPPTLQVAVVMQHTRLRNRWQSAQWQAVGAVADASTPGTAPSILGEDSSGVKWLHPGLALTLYRDEAEGYFLNLTTPQPFVFVMWREEDERALPRAVTASYNEAARMMDAGENVDGVPMPAEWIAWLREFVAEHYRPEPKKERSRPASFRGARRADP